MGRYNNIWKALPLCGCTGLVVYAADKTHSNYSGPSSVSFRWNIYCPNKTRDCLYSLSPLRPMTTYHRSFTIESFFFRASVHATATTTGPRCSRCGILSTGTAGTTIVFIDRFWQQFVDCCFEFVRVYTLGYFPTIIHALKLSHENVIERLKRPPQICLNNYEMYW